MQILAAMRAVHEKGIIHRDLKPENVFIVEEQDGSYTIKIVDFGVSRLDRSAARKAMKLTQTGSVFGTPRYMAPEQARGDREIDHRVDLYACGVLLYEMLTGAVPFDREEYNALIIAITTEEPLHVSSHGVPIPAGLDEIVMRALVKEPDERFADVEEFMQALLPYRSEQPGSMDISVEVDVPQSSEYPTTESAPSEQSATVEAPTSSSVHDSATVESKVSGGPSSTPRRSRETEKTAPGWEGTADAHEKHRSRKVLWVVLAACLVVVVAGGAAGSVLLMRERAGKQVQTGSDPAPEKKTPEVPAEPEGPQSFTLGLAGLPEGAEVYVDGLMHPERPLVVQESEAASVRITAPGYETWEKDLAIAADLSMQVEMVALPPPEEEPPASKKAKKKKKKKKPPVETGGGKKIDRSFPGLK
jgi:serine/threonine-protein kinase